GFHHAAGEEQLLGDGPAHLVGQRPRAVDAAVGGGQEAEAGVLAAHPHVERGGQYRGPAVGQAVDHADGGLGTRADLVAAARADGVARVQLVLTARAIVLALLVNVAAGRERAGAAAGDDDAADLRVAARLHHGLVQLGAQLVVHGVELLGTVQRQDRHALGLLDQDVLGHACLLRVAPPRRGVAYAAGDPGTRRGPWTTACSRCLRIHRSAVSSTVTSGICRRCGGRTSWASARRGSASTTRRRGNPTPRPISSWPRRCCRPSACASARAGSSCPTTIPPSWRTGWRCSITWRR